MFSKIYIYICIIFRHDDEQKNFDFQTEIKYLISGDRYDGKEDFAVVLQPFFHYSFIPQTGVSLWTNTTWEVKLVGQKPNNVGLTDIHQVGETDTSFFSVDCFHLSERTHAEMAIALWNNMVSFLLLWTKQR